MESFTFTFKIEVTADNARELVENLFSALQGTAKVMTKEESSVDGVEMVLASAVMARK